MGSLFLVRHATTAASATGRNLGQRDDPPLTDDGRALAERLAETLSAELDELPHDEIRLVTSPALRCRETAEPIGVTLGLAGPAEVEPAVLEIDYGAWDGLTADECRARDPRIRDGWEADPFRVRCPDGESGADVAARAFPALERIEDWVAADRARCAIVIAHNHVVRLRMCALIGWPMREYRNRISSDPGSYSIVTFGSGDPVVRRVSAPGG